MALVKKSSQGSNVAREESRRDQLELVTGKQNHQEAEAKRRKARTMAKQQQAAERIASATAQLSSGIAESASAAEELKRAMDQIAAGAEESSGAAQQSLRMVSRGAEALLRIKNNAETSQQKTNNLQTLLGEVGKEIRSTVTNVGVAAERQAASVVQVKELEQQSANISEIVKAVARIADQTNLLALNAAIEAASAGKHGKGFAVVADEVRTLAETSENSAREIQNLVSQIQEEVRIISEGINQAAATAKSEMEKGEVITSQLDLVRKDMIDIATGAREISMAAIQADTASKEAQTGSEAIAAAAEEQASACNESVRMINEQTQALAQSEQAARDLSDLADDLKNSSDIGKSAEEVASASEELSSAVQEINRASSQIMSALAQIGKGTEQQSAAAQQSSAAITQIEKSTQLAEERSKLALEKTQGMNEVLEKNQKSVEELIAGIMAGIEETKKSGKQISALERVSGRIDKIVDSITMVSIQTNMLAVSGAIEAARAGEYGKGFVVVSTDIRNLSRDSSENAERIKDLVKAIQEQIGTVGRDLEQIVELAISEVEKTRAISNNLVTVRQDIAELLAGNKDIAAASVEIVGAMTEIKQGVQQIAAAAAEADQATTEASSAAKQQSQGAEELAAAIEEIASLADELQS